MKNKIIILLISAMGLVGTTTFAGGNQEPTDQENCNYGQCQATAKSTGDQCRNCAQQYK